MSAAGVMPQSSRGGRNRWSRLFWLGYLPLYALPYALGAPLTLDRALAGGVGIALFLAVYLDAVSGRPRSVLPHAGFMAAIGVALSLSGGSWSVFNVYAAVFAGRVRPRWRGVLMLAVLCAALAAYGLVLPGSRAPWVFGLFFSVLAGGSAVMQAEAEARHRQLLATQGEVRGLAAAAERERIGRDLHDLLGHTLTLVAVKADLASRLAARDPAAAQAEMDAVAAAARGALAEVRAAVAGMRGASLAVELERARVALEAAGVALLADMAAVAPEAEAVLAMTLREAVTNVVRHAGAQRCRVSAGQDGAGRSFLVVADDGVGGAMAEGAGLSGLRARLAAAGGVVTVGPDGGVGVRVAATMPAP